MSSRSHSSENKPKGNLAAALDYAARGWPVFPLRDVSGGSCSCGNAKCYSPGKHPRTANGLNDGTTDAATIRRWWKRWPSANIGVVTGPESGIWMLGPDEQPGIDVLQELVKEHGELPNTPIARSGSGGQHYIFRWPSVGNVKNRKNHRGLSIDVRGDGGYFVAVPSVSGGGAYSWIVSPDQCEPADAPDWLLEWVRDDGKHRGSSFKVQAGGVSVMDRAIAYRAKTPPAISGQGGHNATMAAARVVVWGFDLGAEVGYQILVTHYNPRCQPPWLEKELRHKCQEADTVPFDKPRGWLLCETATGWAGSMNCPSSESGSAGASARLLPPYTPFPTHTLPRLLASFVAEAAAALGVDPAMVALPAIAVCGSRIGNTRTIQLKNSWREPGVFWSGVCATIRHVCCRAGTRYEWPSSVPPSS